VNKWVTALAAVGAAVLAGLLVRQVAADLSDNAQLWRSVTDDPESD
jgi:hypothetical protein